MLFEQGEYDEQYYRTGRVHGSNGHVEIQLGVINEEACHIRGPLPLPVPGRPSGGP